MMPLKRTCREAASLLIAREDRALPILERLALRLHLLACTACPKFERQLLTMRRGLRQWRNYVADDQAPSFPQKTEKN